MTDPAPLSSGRKGRGVTWFQRALSSRRLSLFIPRLPRDASAAQWGRKGGEWEETESDPGGWWPDETRSSFFHFFPRIDIIISCHRTRADAVFSRLTRVVVLTSPSRRSHARSFLGAPATARTTPAQSRVRIQQVRIVDALFIFNFATSNVLGVPETDEKWGGSGSRQEG